MKKNINIYQELNDIVNAMKYTTNIISVSVLNGVSTVITDSVEIFNNLGEVINLSEGMIVTIDSVNYQVSNIIDIPSVKSFDIASENIPETEWNVAANFQTGSSIEVNEILIKNQGNLNRFPLIWLLPPVNLDHNQVVLDFTADVTLVFIHKANSTDRTSKRINNNFNPIIQPLQVLFNKWLQSSDFNYMLEFYGFGKPIEFNSSDFPYFGNASKTKSVITDISTDAKQMIYNLNFKIQC